MSINLEFLYFFFFLSENGPKFAYFQLPTNGDSGDTSFWLKRLNTERLEQANCCKKLSSPYGHWKWGETFRVKLSSSDKSYFI